MGGFAEIDWNRSWRESRQHRTCKAGGSSDWDRKAASFARRNRDSAYLDHPLMIKRG